MTPLLLIPLLVMGAGRAGSSSGSQPPSIRWEKSFDDAQKKARRSGKPIIVDFWAEWCGWCDRLNRTTYVDPAVVRKSQDFVAVKVDTEGSRGEREVAIRYEVTSLPTIVFLSPQGRQLLRVNGFQSAYRFPTTMHQALQIAHSVIAWEQALANDPDDAEALSALGAHLYEVGREFSQQQALDEARELLRRAVAQDGQEPVEDRRRSRTLLAMLEYRDSHFEQAARLTKDALSLGPKGEDAAALLFVLGRTYLSAGRRTESVQTFQIIINEYPQSPVAQKARETLGSLERR